LASSRQAARPAIGQRERNKADKRHKIRGAASRLFSEHGYDDTTIRAIARRAGVGLGTVFAYAADKRDLLFLIFNDELAAMTAAALAGIDDRRPFLEQVLRVFRAHYRFFAREPALSRFMLRELTFYVAGPEAQRFQVSRAKLERGLTVLVDRAKAGRRLRSQERSVVIARALFSLYQAELRRWLADDEPDLAKGMRALRRMLKLQIVGLAPGPAAL
jgi:AcrR family transcriptional regulator